MGHDERRPANRFTRRRLLQSGAAAGAAGAAAAMGFPGSMVRAVGLGPAGATGTGGSAAPAVTGGNIALVNGRIHTMNATGTVARSIAIRNGRIAAVNRGANAGGTDMTVIDLGGRTVVPGIIDNHNHIVLMGNRPGHHTPLENAYSIADVQQTFSDRAAPLDAGDWITTIGGFHTNQFAEKRLPTLAELDDAIPDHPAYISLSFAGPSTTNSTGKAFFESQGVPVGADGAIAGGFGASPTGQATHALRQTLLTPETRRRGAVDAMAYGAELGVTTHLDQGAFQTTNSAADGAAHEDNYTMHLPFLDLYRAGQLGTRLRINFLHMDADEALPTLQERLRNAFQFFGGEDVRTGGIGEFIAQGTGAAFAEAAKVVAAAGWRAEVHSLSRTDFQAEIAAFEAAHALTPIDELRWVIAHVPFITEDWVDRLKALGGGLSLTGWRYLAGSDNNDGPPFRMIVDNGIPTGMSSDGMQIAPMNPWLHMYYATTGVNAAGALINDGQQISRQEVLRLYTADNGWFLREEDQLGTLEVGKHGDLVVLNDDYFSVPDEGLKQLRSVLTVVGGNVVHDAGAIP
jgi:predicted amidohydrolase YtcJ